MDKFVRKSDVSLFGLESLNTEEILRTKITNTNITYSVKLDTFKKQMINKLYKFDPLKIHNKTDELLKLLWLSFLFSEITPEKQKKLYLEYECK